MPIVVGLQVDQVPTRDKLDRMRRADATASLAIGAFALASIEIFLDRIKRTDLDALVAVNTGRFDFAFPDSKEVQC